MTFNHYAKMKRILALEQPGWFIKRINEPTTAMTFRGEKREFDHYYRIYGANGEPIKYCKFQQIDKLASVLKVSVEDLPVAED